MHVELHLICRIVCAFCMPCLIKSDMHHTCLCIMPCSCVGCLLCCLPSFRCTSSRYSGNIVLWGFVRLRLFVFFMDSFFFLAGFHARWPYPWNHFYLYLLVCSLYCYAYAAIHTTCYIMPPILPCQASNTLFLANRCLAMLPLFSAPLIALLVAGEDWSLILVGTWIFVGISESTSAP